jgi:hypothetical protein
MPGEEMQFIAHNGVGLIRVGQRPDNIALGMAIAIHEAAGAGFTHDHV